jgi:hypothetical protein
MSKKFDSYDRILEKRRPWFVQESRVVSQFSKLQNLTNSILELFTGNSRKKNLYQRLYNVEFVINLEFTTYEIINKESLSLKERTLLIAAIWCFKVGDGTTEPKAQDRSKITELLTNAGFEIKDRERIIRICRHASYMHLFELEKSPAEEVRLRLVSACLVLAECFCAQCKFENVPSPNLQTNDVFVQVIPDETAEKEDLYLHWIKRILSTNENQFPKVHDTVIDSYPATKVTKYSLRNPFTKNPGLRDADDFDLSAFRENLKSNLKSDFKTKIHVVRKVVFSYLRSTTDPNKVTKLMSIIDRNKVNVLSTYVEIEFIDDLEIDNNLLQIITLISDVITHRKASASSLAVDILKIFSFLMGSNKSNIDKIKEFNDKIFYEFLQKNRPCHVILWKIYRLINKITNENFGEIRSELRRFEDQRKLIDKRIYENAKPLMINLDAVILFGYSKSIISIFENLCSDKTLLPGQLDKIRTMDIYVGLCHNKDKFNYLGDLTYSDGVHYVNNLKKLGFQNIHLTPDSILGSVIKDLSSINQTSGKNQNQKKINRIIFGANGINLITSEFGHTAGHSVLADLSTIYNMPIYIVADTWKFGEFNEEKASIRKSKWLPPNILKQVDFDKELYNPREDKVELFVENRPGLRLLITDKGVFYTNDVPFDIATNFNI